jgi:hypothetical protein
MQVSINQLAHVTEGLGHSRPSSEPLYVRQEAHQAQRYSFSGQKCSLNRALRHVPIPELKRFGTGKTDKGHQMGSFRITGQRLNQHTTSLWRIHEAIRIPNTSSFSLKAAPGMSKLLMRYQGAPQRNNVGACKSCLLFRFCHQVLMNIFHR